MQVKEHDKILYCGFTATVIHIYSNHQAIEVEYEDNSGRIITETLDSKTINSKCLHPSGITFECECCGEVICDDCAEYGDLCPKCLYFA